MTEDEFNYTLDDCWDNFLGQIMDSFNLSYTEMDKFLAGLDHKEVLNIMSDSLLEVVKIEE